MYTRQYFTDKPVHKLYRWIPEGSLWHHTLIHTRIIIHMETFFTSACDPRKKILSETNLSHSSLLHPRALHTSSSTSIDSIKWDHFPIGQNINKSIQPKQVDSNTNLSQNISLFPSLGLQPAQLIPKDIVGLRRRSTWRPLYTNFIK